MIVKKQSAFTLMEVMIAVLIIGILATIAGPAVFNQLKKVKVNTTKSILATLKGAINEYNGDVGALPKRLEDLVEQPTDPKIASHWHGSYLSKTEVPLDGWNHPIEYHTPPVRYKNELKYFELYSYGADGEESTDDIFNGE
jgi:general secretion pathway protein G